MNFLNETPHYAIGDYSTAEGHVPALDLELETLQSRDEVIERLVTLAAGEPFISKSGGEFSIPNKKQRIAWIKSLRDDFVFKNMLSKFDLDPDEEFFDLLLELTKL